MNPQRYTAAAEANSEDPPAAGEQAGSPKPKKRRDAKAEQASRSVMHPESYDPEWRYYHGAWGG